MFHTPAHKNLAHPPGQITNPVLQQEKSLQEEIKEYQEKQALKEIFKINEKK